MELNDFQGLRIGEVDAAEALNGEWAVHSGQIDVIRVEKPALQDWPALRAAGFLCKPFLVSWIADAQPSEEEFLARLTLKERQNIRAARRRADQDGLKWRVQPLDEDLLDTFLQLYRNRVEQMRHGWAVAAEQRGRLLDARDEHFAVCAYADDELVGCCLGWQRAHLDMVQMRYSAVDSRRRDAGLARALYLAVAQEARQRGFGRLSLGMDPNIYGHIAKPGLFGFKSRLGFVGMPSNLVDAETGHDQADLVASLDRLSDPSLILSYANDEPGMALRLEVLTRREGVSPAGFGAHFAVGHRIHLIASGS
jgi:GNAT superfamily N-acetyltransferase